MIISDDKLVVNSTAKINNQEVNATKKIENSMEMIKNYSRPLLVLTVMPNIWF